MKLEWENLPQEIKEMYQKAEIYRIHKKGSSTITVRTLEPRIDVWEKHGGKFIFQSKRTLKEDTPLLLFGQPLPKGIVSD